MIRFDRSIIDGPTDLYIMKQEGQKNTLRYYTLKDLCIIEECDNPLWKVGEIRIIPGVVEYYD